MIKDQELLNSITNVKDTQPRTFAELVVRYDVNGKSDKTKKKKIEDKNACAIEIVRGREKIYKVKAKRNGEIFNPQKVGMLYNLDMLDRITNDPSFNFRLIGENGFNAYIAFLETGKENFLYVAERDVRHGS